MGRGGATAAARAALERLNVGVNELHKLADVPMEQLMTIRTGAFGPVLDGKVIVQHPFVPAPAPYVAHVPLFIGHNRDEATLSARNSPEIFTMDDTAMVARLRRELGAERADLLLPVYRRSRPNATTAELYIALASAGTWAYSLAEAESKLSQHGAPVYMYRYDYPSNLPIPGTDWTMRAGHATEIQAKFENADIPGLMGNASDRFQATRNFGECWAAFARTGHPKITGAPTWSAYDLRARATMLIDVTCSLVNDPNKDEREIWQAILSRPGSRWRG